MQRASGAPAHVVIAGGGFAALEAAVALRALAGDRVRLTVVSPESRFTYRPAATAEVFTQNPPLTYGLAQLLAGIGASYETARLEAVLPRVKRVRLSSGLQLGYDKLIIAIGVRPHAAVAGALTFRDQRDVPAVRRALDTVARAGAGHLALAIPSRRCWPLPVYELALLVARMRDSQGLELEIVLATGERAPLEVLGTQASGVVAELLRRRGVRLHCGAAPREVSRDGRLDLGLDAPVIADEVIAIPELRGQRIPGLPASWFGFVPTDEFGRVQDLVDVYAAGDMTTFPIKHGGLGTQQADRIAHLIAGELGAAVRELRFQRVVQVRLLAGEQAVSLRIEVDDFGSATTTSIERDSGPMPAHEKVFARYLAPYLERHVPLGTVAAA